MGVDLQLFASWGTTVQAHAAVIENIIMFIPFGILLPYLFKPAKGGWICISCAMTISICLEYLQLKTRRGFCQMDDVIMNTLGTGLGWGIVALFNNGKCWGKQRNQV